MIRHDIEKPLSTDNAIWPSIIIKLLSQDTARANALRDVWFREDLRGLSRYLNATLKGDRRNYWVVGITVLHESYDEEDTYYPSIPVNGLPASSPPYDCQEWSLLGYDVSDEWYTSGLSNCGYYPEEVKSLGRKYGPHLNKYHLFMDKNKAVEYMKIADDRIPEHAPFYVYGLYLIEDHSK